MWVILGFLIAAAIGLVVALAACERGSVQSDSYPWILYDTVKSHVGIMGGLAGFSFTGIVLVVTLAQDRPGVANSSVDTVIVMFLVAYLWWVGNAFLITYIPHKETSGDLVPRVHFSLAVAIEYRTVFLSWFALLPLLEANGLGRLALSLYFLLPASLIFGSVLIAMTADGLGLIRFKETSFISGCWYNSRGGLCHHRSISSPQRSLAFLFAVSRACHVLYQWARLRVRSAHATLPPICRR